MCGLFIRCISSHLPEDKCTAIFTNDFIFFSRQCRELGPEYSAAAQELAYQGSSAKLAYVDATREKTIADQYNIRGFPTLYFFK